jgi:hypothetical protein
MLARALAQSIVLLALGLPLTSCGSPSSDETSQADPEVTTEDYASEDEATDTGAESENAEPEGYSTLPSQERAAETAPPARQSAPAQTVSNRGRGDIGMFYDALDRYGAWVQHPDYSYVWIPSRMGAGWRPYQDGRWVWTDDYGWYWESEEPFGWAVYHYGRWDYDPDYGWFWVPGDTWAPAWVTWRYGGDTVGWAPIAPDQPGFARGAPRRYDPPVAEGWVFVDARNFGDDDLAPYVLPASRIGPSLEIAGSSGRLRFEDGRVFNPGAPRADIQRYVGRPLPTRRIVSVGAEIDMFDDDAGFRIGIYRPVIAAGGARAPRRVGDPGQSGRVMIRDYAGPGPAGRYDAPSAALLDVLDRQERQNLAEARLTAKQAAVDARIDRLRKEHAALIEQRRKEAKKLEAKLEKEREKAKEERQRNREIVRAQKRERAAAMKDDRPAGAQPAPVDASPTPQPAPVIEAQPEPAPAPAPKEAATPDQPKAEAEAPPSASSSADEAPRRPIRKKDTAKVPEAVEPAPAAMPSPEAVPPAPEATGAVEEPPRKKKRPQKDQSATGDQPPQAVPDAAPPAPQADAPLAPRADAPPEGGRKKVAKPAIDSPDEAMGAPALAPAPPSEVQAPAAELPPPQPPAERADRKRKREGAAPDDAAAPPPEPPAVTGEAAEPVPPQEQPSPEVQ